MKLSSLSSLSCLVLAGLGSASLWVSPLRAQEPPRPPTPPEEKEDKKDPKEEDEEKEGKLKIITDKDQAKLDLDALITPTGIWDWTPEKVEEAYKKGGFQWLSKEVKDRGILRPAWMLLKEETKDAKTTRLQGTRGTFQILQGKSEAEEVQFDFKDGKLALLTLSIWNKGDAEKDLSEKRFKEKLGEVTAALTTRMGVRAQEVGKDTGSASKAFRTRWETPGTFAQLEHSSTKERERGFQAEFIRLRLAPKAKAVVGSIAKNAASVSAQALASRVKREPTGDMWIPSVPMVDQGDKGYCALASSERVMRYLGIQCDQHDLAQATKGDGGGTDPDQLQDALHRLQTRFGIHVRDIIHWDQKDYVKFPEIYNREAKKIGAKSIPESYASSSFRFFDTEALRSARCRGDQYTKFVKNVSTYIQQGTPLLWGLELGIYPEDGQKTPQAAGGHMRLIIGYNEKKDEIIFSDSWGAGHEKKRMAGKDAFSVTKGLYMIEPRR